MRALDGPVSHFDHVLTAMLLLAHVAQRQGDAVGLLTFAGERVWLAPRRRAGLGPLLAAIHDLQPSLRASDYLEAARDLMARVRKRSLVVLLTNLRDEDEETLAPALRLLRKRHRVILASLREPGLDQARAQPPERFEQALRAGAVEVYLAERRRAFARIDPGTAGQGTAGHGPGNRGGTTALDVVPAELPVALVNRYLAVKRSGAG
jgi:uncharacterized protein (DUF58 family)